MANVPIDIITTCILPKLPLKSLVRFKCVSKSWKTLISCEDFIHFLHRHALSSDADRLLISEQFGGPKKHYYLHNVDSPLDPPSMCPYPVPPNTSSYMVTKIVASCEFFLLINSYSTEPFLYDLHLLNPSTASYYKLPQDPNPSLYRDVYFGLYIDETNNDYKVVKIMQHASIEYNGSFHTEVWVYSFKTNLWRFIENKMDRFYGFSTVTAVTGHLFHITFQSIDRVDINDKIKVGCFDMLAEQWTNDVPLPDKLLRNTAFQGPELCVIDGMLCVLGYYREDSGTVNYTLWAMKEYGVKESWVKLMSTNIWDFRPICYRKGSRDELLCRRVYSSVLFWYNLRDKKSAEAEFNGVPGGGPKSTFGHLCRGSIDDFRGGR